MTMTMMMMIDDDDDDDLGTVFPYRAICSLKSHGWNRTIPIRFSLYSDLFQLTVYKEAIDVDFCVTSYLNTRRTRLLGTRCF